MRKMTSPPTTIASAIKELGADLGISEADFGGKLKIEGKDPVVASSQWGKWASHRLMKGWERT